MLELKNFYFHFLLEKILIKLYLSISRTGEVNEISDDINNDVDRVITEKVNSVESSKDHQIILDHEFKCELCDFETQRKAEFDDHMLKEHVIAIEQIDGNTSTTCNEPSDIETSECISSFTDAFQVGDITLSSSMNESLSPSINTSTTNKPRRTSNKPKKNQINLEDDDNISMASSPGENAKECQRTLDRIEAILETFMQSEVMQSLSNPPQDSKW